MHEARDAHGRRRHPGHARVHLARAAARRSRRGRPLTSGRSACCSGRRSPARTRSGAARSSTPRDGSRTARRRSPPCAPTSTGDRRMRRPRARRRPGSDDRPPQRSRRGCARSLPALQTLAADGLPAWHSRPHQRATRGSLPAGAAVLFTRVERRRAAVLPRGLAARRSRPVAGVVALSTSGSGSPSASPCRCCRSETTRSGSLFVYAAAAARLARRRRGATPKRGSS